MLPELRAVSTVNSKLTHQLLACWNQNKCACQKYKNLLKKPPGNCSSNTHDLEHGICATNFLKALPSSDKSEIKNQKAHREITNDAREMSIYIKTMNIIRQGDVVTNKHLNHTENQNKKISDNDDEINKKLYGNDSLKFLPGNSFAAFMKLKIDPRVDIEAIDKTTNKADQKKLAPDDEGKKDKKNQTHEINERIARDLYYYRKPLHEMNKEQWKDLSDERICLDFYWKNYTMSEGFKKGNEDVLYLMDLVENKTANDDKRSENRKPVHRINKEEWKDENGNRNEASTEECKGNGKDEKEPEDTSDHIDVELPEEPTTCCMSGCANCVWIEYAEKLNELFSGESQKTRRIILEKIQDPNMRAFLQMELDNLKSRDEDEKT